MAVSPVKYTTASAVAKMMNPEMPVAFKKVLGPSSYDVEKGFSITIEELPDAPIYKVLDPIIGGDGSIVIATNVQRTANNILNMHFEKLVADTSTGAVSSQELADSSAILDGVEIYIMALGGVTQGVVESSA